MRIMPMPIGCFVRRLGLVGHRALIFYIAKLGVYYGSSFGRVEDKFLRWDGCVYYGAFEREHIPISLGVEDEHASYLGRGGVDVH